MDQELWSAFAYNLFVAAELGVKAELLMLPDKTLLNGRSHKPLHSRIKKWGKLGNVDSRHVSAFNTLSHLRPHAHQLACALTEGRGGADTHESRTRQLFTA
ncbi:MAG: hypothetical protein GXP55_21425 [Deltaproteobacteria bacterium]|nr:hypothetical protein [Deltaproteobacteria bacterium]